MNLPSHLQHLDALLDLMVDGAIERMLAGAYSERGEDRGALDVTPRAPATPTKKARTRTRPGPGVINAAGSVHAPDPDGSPREPAAA